MRIFIVAILTLFVYLPADAAVSAKDLRKLCEGGTPQEVRGASKPTCEGPAEYARSVRFYKFSSTCRQWFSDAREEIPPTSPAEPERRSAARPRREYINYPPWRR
jgi:hypothetical protein